MDPTMLFYMGLFVLGLAIFFTFGGK